MLSVWSTSIGFARCAFESSSKSIAEHPNGCRMLAVEADYKPTNRLAAGWLVGWLAAHLIIQKHQSGTGAQSAFRQTVQLDGTAIYPARRMTR